MASLRARHTIRSLAIPEVTRKVIHQRNTNPTLHPVQNSSEGDGFGSDHGNTRVDPVVNVRHHDLLINII